MGATAQAMIRPVDLRLRLMATLLALVIFTPVKSFTVSLAGLCAVLLLHGVWRQPVPWRRLLHLEVFLVLLLATLPFTLPGTELFRVGSLVASTEGAWRALVIACKVTASVLMVSLLFASEDPLAIGTALRGLGVPESLVRLFISVVRYVQLIRPEYTRLRESMRARAFMPRTNRHTFRSYGYLLGMLLVRAIERAERVEEAMLLRGYSGRFPKIRQPTPPCTDCLAAVGLLAAAACLLFWDLA